MISLHKNLPIEIFTYLMAFLNDSSNHLLISTCKYFYNYSKKNGYLSYLKADSNLNMMTFLNRCCIHFKTLKTIEIHSIDDPQVWLIDYVESIIFNNCYVLCINPKKKVKTKKIIINDFLNRYKNKVTLTINWECFPELEYLQLTSYDVKINNLKKCKKLKQIIINTLVGQSIYYNNIGELYPNFDDFTELEYLELSIDGVYVTSKKRKRKY